jgi:hypothetical protein
MHSLAAPQKLLAKHTKELVAILLGGERARRHFSMISMISMTRTFSSVAH